MVLRFHRENLNLNKKLHLPMKYGKSSQKRWEKLSIGLTNSSLVGGSIIASDDQITKLPQWREPYSLRVPRKNKPSAK